MNKERVTYLIDKYGNMVLRLAVSYLKNKQDAEDIVQNVFLMLCEKELTFENTEHEKAYIIKTTINACKNKFKLFWNKKVCSISEIIEEGSSDEYNVGSPVFTAVMNLPTKFRIVIHLYYYEGYKTSEIATLLHKNESTIRSDLHRAREQLKIKLKEEYDFE